MRAATLADIPNARVFGAEEPPPPGDPRGAVRAAGKRLYDDAGNLLPMVHTFFWLPWGLTFDVTRTLKNLDYMDAHGAAGSRFFAVSGDGGANVRDDSWYDRTLNPGVNGWEVWTDAQDRTLQELRHRGLRAIVTLFGTSGRMSRDDRLRVTRMWAELLRTYRAQVLYVEISNEEKVTPAEAQEHLQLLRAAHGDLLVTATASDWSGVANLSALHPERKVTGDGGYWEHCEQMYAFHECPYVGSCQEPIGPDSSVAADSDPARLCADAGTALVCGAPIYCYHPGAGIRGGGEADRLRGRQANFYDEPTLDETWHGLRALVDLAPSDIAAIGHVAHSHPKNGHQNGGYFPFETGPLEPFVPDGFLKFYTCAEGILGGRFAGSLLNITKDLPLQAPAHMRFTVAEYPGRAPIHVELSAGETFTVRARGGIFVTGEFL